MAKLFVCFLSSPSLESLFKRKKLETAESFSFRFQVQLNSVAAIKVSVRNTFFRGSKTFAESAGKLEFRSSKILFAFFPIKSTKKCDKPPTVRFELVILNSISAGNSNWKSLTFPWWLAIRPIQFGYQKQGYACISPGVQTCYPR